MPHGSFAGGAVGRASLAVTRVLLACLWLALVTTASSAQPAPTPVGTWRLNLAKSVYRLGPPPLGQTIVIGPSDSSSGGGLMVAVETRAAPGVRIRYEYTAVLDGPEAPVTGEFTPNGAETVTLTRVDPLTIEATFRRTLEVVLTTRIAVSSDGQVLTLTSTGTNRNEQPTDSIAVLDRRD